MTRAVGTLWKPWGAVRVDGVPAAGSLVADDHTVWRVVEVVELDCDPDWPGARTHELVLQSLTGPRASRRVPTGPYSAWWAYADRYPVCSCCGEPPPCREQLADEAVERALDRMRRFELAGVCPACGQPVTARQRAATFPDNIEIPLGPPVTFHLAPAACRRAAAAYQRAWLACFPDRPEIAETTPLGHRPGR